MDHSSVNWSDERQRRRSLRSNGLAVSSKATFLSLGLLVVVVLAVLVGWRVTTSAQGDRASKRAAPSISVVTELATIKSMPIQLLAVGQVQSEHTVNIQPQVSGMLKTVYFTEGQHVRAGQPLFLIDPKPYEAALASAKASHLAAKTQADREKPLSAKGYVSPQEYESSVATAAQTEAALQQAQINLSYTRIASPIDGLTGNLMVKSGNVVSPTNTAPLVTINQMKPILVQYNLSQQFLPQIRKYYAEHKVKVFISNEDGTGQRGEGNLVFIDNTVNTATGTVLFKAEIPNTDIQLWPGEYVGVNTRLAVEANAVTIPNSAVQSGQNGNFVYEIIDGVAKVQNITVNRVVGTLAVISSGLKGGERVVTQVPRSLRPGLPVTTNAPVGAALGVPAVPSVSSVP